MRVEGGGGGGREQEGREAEGEVEARHEEGPSRGLGEGMCEDGSIRCFTMFT